MFETDYFTFVTGQATDVGCVRDVNEDSFLTRPESGLWVVADGMGGHAAGDYASQTIVKQLFTIGIPASGEDLQARFMERLTQANDHILDHAIELDRGAIGATLVALLVHGVNYACIWSGDSRIYRFRDGQLEQLTTDHTEVQALLDAGAISEEDAANWPRKNVITRAIGVTETPQCDIVGGTAQVGDRFILCSDGLTEHLTDADIAQYVAAYDPQTACDLMIRETLSRGGKDNVTVILMQCDTPPPPSQEVFDDDGLDFDFEGLE